MHQPYYRDDLSEETTMPWTRLHAIKNYYDIPEMLTENNNLKMTFNLVPSLLKQINHIIKASEDPYEKITKTPADELTESQMQFILKNFFMIHPNLIQALPRYLSLWKKRGKSWPEVKDKINPAKFSKEEYRDIQVLYHLSWCGWALRKRAEIKDLIKKGENYSEQDKAALLEMQREFLKEIIPLYKRLQEEGRIEITTSPFYHPILPLLIDPSIAEKSTPDVPLPENAAGFPRDAEAQVREAIEYHTAVFGNPPRGIWPSEGSVSDAVLELLVDAGISWAATDNEILRKTLKSEEISDDSFLKPYLFSGVNGELMLFFRDHYLSDKIGFTYSRMKPKDAVDDFISHLRKKLHKSSLDHPHVCIILDGENAWEFFPDNGKDFLLKLTSTIENTEWIETLTFSEYIDQFGNSAGKIEHIHPGSWIYANFNTWIGNEEKNRAWELLINTRRAVEAAFEEKELDNDLKRRIMNEIFIAEGSDWFWWYGDDHHTEFAEEFDAAFRRHLINVYKLLQIEPPEELYIPVCKKEKQAGIINPVSFINPTLDGESGSFYEWRGCGVFNPLASHGAIHRSEYHINKINFGFNLDNLYIRLITSPHPAREKLQGFEIIIEFFDSIEKAVVLSCSHPPGLIDRKEQKEIDAGNIKIGCNQVIELGIGWKTLGVKPLQQINLAVLLKKGTSIEERHPVNSNIIITVPDENFEGRNWIV